MSREIKFRVWCPLLERFSLDTEDGYIYQEDDFGSGEFTVGSNDGGILQQFTGLKDKNGKDIYEGDILKLLNPDRIYEVIFCKGCFAAVNYEYKDEFALYQFDEKEVIGNIFETPELLKS